ncbi:hypothetical protein EVAR_12086_1 [Eumeta japonica]|uniref:Uncharacterized protein n=1 Tax=Eumeta variegata TaxID=151549 RepID=A0A4C1U513_EUMVA|nr:hypothetical protein EVAR_12086_1 [Eumeta japonica]
MKARMISVLAVSSFHLKDEEAHSMSMPASTLKREWLGRGCRAPGVLRDKVYRIWTSTKLEGDVARRENGSYERVVTRSCASKSASGAGERRGVTSSAATRRESSLGLRAASAARPRDQLKPIDVLHNIFHVTR